MPPKIRAALRDGETRRHAVIPDDDPERERLLRIVKLRDLWIAEGRPPKHLFVTRIKQYALDNMGLCVSYVNDLDERHVPREDMVQEAVGAFIDAVMRFDVKKAGRVSTFSMHRLRHECDTLINDRQGPVVRVPGQLRDDRASVMRLYDAGLSKTGTPPSDAEILGQLQAEEVVQNERRSKEHKKPNKRWASYAVEDLADLRKVRVDRNYEGLEVLDSGSYGDSTPIDVRLDLLRLVKKLSPKLQTVVALEYGIGEPGPTPTDPVIYEMCRQLAVSLLKKWMEGS